MNKNNAAPVNDAISCKLPFLLDDEISRNLNGIAYGENGRRIKDTIDIQPLFPTPS